VPPEPTTSPQHHPHWRRFLAIAIIALISWLLALALSAAAPRAAARSDNLFYDTYYRTRPHADMQNAEVVLVAVNDRGLQEVARMFHYGWPWPRQVWGDVVRYLDAAGAKAIVFDIVFTEPSIYQSTAGDDDNFAEAVKSAKTPIVFGAAAHEKKQWDNFAPPIPNPTFGAVNVGDDYLFRKYPPSVHGQHSLATAAVVASGAKPALPTNEPFLLHYYGPYKNSSGKTTFRYVSAATLQWAQIAKSKETAEALGQTPEFFANLVKEANVTPDMFKNKIVVLGAITKGTFDLKASPLSDEYPGPEVQATAIQNLLLGHRVVTVAPIWLWIVPLLCALFISAGVVIPRRASLKVLTPILVLAALIGAGIWLFQQNTGTIIWLPPTTALLTIAFATLAAFAWTYFAEDRQRRFMLKALSKVVSPAVAEQLAQEPERLTLGTTKGELTILFTDLANFTNLSEGMDVQSLGKMLNRYLGEMSDQVLENHGTLDKYIGDAIMCFWNAPLTQADHAILACRAALGMVRHEQMMQADLAAMGAKKVFTRIGINTADSAYGFVGSAHLFNYTVLGDGVNLASRVEGANKMYGTQILITGNTARLVKDAFHIRKVDTIRVKGKTEPMAIYELLAEKSDPAAARFAIVTETYEAALAAYQQQRWDDAEKLLLELSKAFGEDGPSKTMQKRINAYRITPPPPDWDGVYEATEK
jgi:adenylate cyclase